MSHIASSSWFTLLFTPDCGIFWPPITIRTITFLCQTGFKNWTFTCRLLHPVGKNPSEIPAKRPLQSGIIINSGEKSTRNLVGPGRTRWDLAPSDIWELNCLREPPNWKDSYGWNDWNILKRLAFCRHHCNSPQKSLVRMGSPINSPNWTVATVLTPYPLWISRHPPISTEISNSTIPPVLWPIGWHVHPNGCRITALF